MREKKEIRTTVNEDDLADKTLVLRGRKVMLDTDLAALYGIPVKKLMDYIEQNIKRFPDDFMFRLTPDEKCELADNYPQLKKLKSFSDVTYAFTDHGTLMLAGILDSPRAIEMSIQVVRIFNHMRDMVCVNDELLEKVQELEHKVWEHDDKIRNAFRQLRRLNRTTDKPRKPIGFKISGKTPGKTRLNK